MTRDCVDDVGALHDRFVSGADPAAEPLVDRYGLPVIDRIEDPQGGRDLFHEVGLVNVGDPEDRRTIQSLYRFLYPADRVAAFEAIRPYQEPGGVQ